MISDSRMAHAFGIEAFIDDRKACSRKSKSRRRELLVWLRLGEGDMGSEESEEWRTGRGDGSDKEAETEVSDIGELRGAARPG